MLIINKRTLLNRVTIRRDFSNPSFSKGFRDAVSDFVFLVEGLPTIEKYTEDYIDVGCIIDALTEFDAKEDFTSEYAEGYGKSKMRLLTIISTFKIPFDDNMD